MFQQACPEMCPLNPLRGVNPCLSVGRNWAVLGGTPGRSLFAHGVPGDINGFSPLKTQNGRIHHISRDDFERIRSQ